MPETSFFTLTPGGLKSPGDMCDEHADYGDWWIDERTLVMVTNVDEDCSLSSMILEVPGLKARAARCCMETVSAIRKILHGTGWRVRLLEARRKATFSLEVWPRCQ